MIPKYTTGEQVGSTEARPADLGQQVCRLYLIRHGTTTMNAENRYRGRRDVPLDVQGWADAVEAARQLSSLGLTAVYSNLLRRTINTAQVIADECRIPDIRILHGLINLDYGTWEGMTIEEAEIYDPAAYRKYTSNPSRASCPSGERLADAQRRMVEAIQLIGERHSGESVAAVTHAVMIRLLIAEILGIDDERWRTPVGRGSITTFDVSADRIHLVAQQPGGDID